jgi:hypothetical protein
MEVVRGGQEQEDGQSQRDWWEEPLRVMVLDYE